MCIALDARSEKKLKRYYLESLGMGNWKTFCFEHIEDNKYTLLRKKSIKVFFSYCFSETEAKILKTDIEGILAAKRKSKF